MSNQQLVGKTILDTSFSGGETRRTLLIPSSPYARALHTYGFQNRKQAFTGLSLKWSS